jgi:hypothetical protein
VHQQVHKYSTGGFRQRREGRADFVHERKYMNP